MLLITLYALGLTALFAAAVAISRTYGEGFGCMGIGVMWCGWCVVFVAWLVYGVASLLAAAVLYYAVERPGLRLRTRVLSRG